MKHLTPSVKFTTDKPILPDMIYLIQSGEVKKVVSKGSLERIKLTGHWIVIKQFENKDK